MNKKKLLLLGGSMQQVVAIEKAKEMGYYTILCDFLDDNPGREVADKYYNVSTTDVEAILSIAKLENIDGIICYASDPAAYTQAYVASKLGLYGNPLEAVKILSNKNLFRQFLRENHFCSPNYLILESNVLLDDLEWNLKFPVMVKPVDSSGSKGVSKVLKIEDINVAIDNARRYSRCGKVIIEEYVEMYGYQVAGDGFSLDGKLVFACLGNDHFDKFSPNPFVPVAASFPYNMPKRVHKKIFSEIQRVFDLLNLKTGAYNFDIRIDALENVYLMEIGPRNGGNMIPQVIEYITGVDLLEYTIKASLGEDCSDLSMKETKGYYSYYAIHSKKTGKFRSIKMSKEIKEEHLVEEHLSISVGDEVMAYTGSNGTIGLLILKFSSMGEMLQMIDNMDNYIEVVVD